MVLYGGVLVECTKMLQFQITQTSKINLYKIQDLNIEKCLRSICCVQVFLNLVIMKSKLTVHIISSYSMIYIMLYIYIYIQNTVHFKSLCTLILENGSLFEFSLINICDCTIREY